MLRILQILFGIISFGFALYGLVSKNYEHNSIMLLFLGCMMLVIGVQEFQQNNYIAGIISLLICGLLFFGAIQSFIYIR